MGAVIGTLISGGVGVCAVTAREASGVHESEQ